MRREGAYWTNEGIEHSLKTIQARSSSKVVELDRRALPSKKSTGESAELEMLRRWEADEDHADFAERRLIDCLKYMLDISFLNKAGLRGNICIWACLHSKSSNANLRANSIIV